MVPRDIILSLFTERPIVESAALETVLLLSFCLEKLTVALLTTDPGPKTQHPGSETRQMFVADSQELTRSGTNILPPPSNRDYECSQQVFGA